MSRISRRTVLRGLGAAVALPWLESMLPVVSMARGAAPAAKPPVRMAFVYVPNGMHMPDWTPVAEGSDFELRPILEPLAKFKSDLTMFSGLTLNGARALGDGGGDHARSVAAFLTGAHPRKTDGANIKNGVSVDQVAAEKIGKLTRFTSLELGCEPSATSGNCDSGYSCAYTSNMSWRTPETPLAKETNPRAVFDRLFGSGDDREKSQSSAKREAFKRSILDSVGEDAGDLLGKLGASDKRKVDEYLYAVRDIERRIAESEKLRGREADVPDYPRPAGAPAQYEEHVRMMLDLMVLAMQTDSTRVLSFMYTNDSSNRSYPQIDVKEGHHDLSHHGNDKEKQAKISKINRFHLAQFAYFVEKLKAAKEGESTLLASSMIVYGSGIADGNAHDHHDLPILLVGQGGGSIASGRHMKFKSETPLTNLYLSMLDRIGAPTDALGDSTGKLPGLDA